MISCRRDEDVSTVRAAPELLLLPPSPLEWLPEDHLAYFIVDVVSQLDLRKIVEPYEREERGYPPHHPQMMLGLLPYGYCVGRVVSLRLCESEVRGG